ncbi:class I adenylate-forming enzyme family protein [Actinoplanes utahensis]|uniref:Peptide synthetase n=1 Tax=Actinoplanes utahensis TaxID=1869 RepID=A0A0A6UUZ9_ACTUT|nr:AMP-binding protein [Actinoplanes utahensis]KHD78264.1 hypothetical protein MB27_05295 [Actinoplanes utahensis]GIF28859.1 long-chain-fatty-acid--CoA ligase [Actinoplanes utahensis]
MHDVLDLAARLWPGRLAVRDGSGADTYAELADASRAVAAGLARRGIRAGDRVLLRLPGGRDFARVLYGVMRAGAVVVPVGTTVGEHHLRWMRRDAEPRLVVALGDPARTAEAVGVPATDVVSPAELLAQCGPDTGAPVPGDAVAMLLYTSGSTGMPRAVVCPHDRVRFAAEAIQARLGYNEADVVLSRVPVAFDYGLYQLFLCALSGAQLVLRPDLVDASMLREARTVAATVLPLVPSLAAILLRLARRDTGAPPVRLVTNTGAALSAAHASGLRRIFPDARIVPMYGMTECKRITIAEPDEDLRFPGTVGRPLDGTEVSVVDASGHPVAPGVTGEIVVTGPHVMAGYWRSPEATAGRFHQRAQEGVMLRTGDYGRLDEGGRLYFAGRRDDIFKRRGVRMNTHEIEAVLLDVPEVSAAAVVPPGEDGTLTAYVVSDREATEVLADVASRIEPAKVPDRCVVLPRLPTTANGKVDRDALRALEAVAP